MSYDATTHFALLMAQARTAAVTDMIPNHLAVVARLAAAYPAEWSAAHRGGPDTEAFIRRLAWELHQIDPRFGLNGKRGNPDDLSDDCVCFDGFASGADYDPTRGNAPVTVIDVIGGAGGSNPTAAWSHPLTPAAAAWVRPAPVSGTGGGGGTVDPPVVVPPPVACGYDSGAVLALVRDVDAVGHQVEMLAQDHGRLMADVGLLRAEIADLIARLQQGLIVDANARYLGAIRGTVRLP
jgi:hypothetical protein